MTKYANSKHVTEKKYSLLPWQKFSSLRVCGPPPKWCGKIYRIENTNDDVDRININATVAPCFLYLLYSSLDGSTIEFSLFSFLSPLLGNSRLREIRTLYEFGCVCACGTSVLVANCNFLTSHRKSDSVTRFIS